MAPNNAFEESMEIGNTNIKTYLWTLFWAPKKLISELTNFIEHFERGLPRYLRE